MGEGRLPSDMKTIVSTDVEQEPSVELLQTKQNLKKKPRSIPNTKTFKPLLEFSDLPQKGELTKPKPSSSKILSDNEIKQKEKKALEKILKELDEVRLNLTGSGGQGFLMNASAIISSYIRNNYTEH